MGRKMVNRTPAFVDALVQVGVLRLMKAPITSDAQALSAMHDIASSICRIFERTVLYVPINAEADRVKRDHRIAAEYAQDGPDGEGKFTSHRVQSLATQYRLTVGHIYIILRSLKATDRQSPACGGRLRQPAAGHRVSADQEATAECG